MRYFLLGATAAVIIAFCSCSDSDPVEATPLQLISVTPASGESLLGSTAEITFEFDQPISISDTSKILLNDVKVTSAYTAARYLKATVEVEQGNDYTFSVYPGAITVFNSTVENTEQYSTQFTMLTYDPSRSLEASSLLSWMTENTGKKMLSSTIANVNWNNNEANWVNYHTGRYPAINCYDFIHFIYSEAGGWIDYSDLTPVNTWVNGGGIVSAMWHWGMLCNDGVSYSCTPGTEDGETSFNPGDIFYPESEGYQKMIEDIDQISEWLLPIQRMGQPVIWRPLHEAQGNWSEEYPGVGWHTAWMWWGIDGPESFKELWHVMYDRMVNYHGLDNLIWVFTAGDSEQWYPGDDYVDIVGYDFYDKDMTEMKYWYDYLKETYPDKLVAICECGSIPKISEMWAEGLYWNYFMPWYDSARTSDPTSTTFTSREHNNADADYWDDAFSCDFVVTRDQVSYQ